MKNFSFACLVAKVHLVAKNTHPHWETRPCRICDKKNATRQAIENFWPCRVSALILEISCRVVCDKTRILVSSADQPLSFSSEKFKIDEFNISKLLYPRPEKNPPGVTEFQDGGFCICFLY